MRCTSDFYHEFITRHSRRLRSLCLSVLMILCLMVTGCGDPDFSFPYNPDYEVSGFRISEDAAGAVASSFAEKLCVTVEDIQDAAVLMDNATAGGLFALNTGKVMYAKNVHERLHPASLTKLMTAVVALKYSNPDDMITVTQEAMVNEAGAQLCGLNVGDKLTLNQALHAMLIYSANDAAAAIAVHVGGSLEGFSDLMNKEARAIGATNSHFVNPHGLTADDHYVTAYDMYLIFNTAVKYELVNEIIHMQNYETVINDASGNSRTIKVENTNRFITGNYKAPETVTIIGGKTGTTSAAGSCLILLVKDTAGNPYIAIILQATDREALYNQMISLLGTV